MTYTVLGALPSLLSCWFCVLSGKPGLNREEESPGPPLPASELRLYAHFTR